MNNNANSNQFAQSGRGLTALAATESGLLGKRSQEIQDLTFYQYEQQQQRRPCVQYTYSSLPLLFSSQFGEIDYGLNYQ